MFKLARRRYLREVFSGGSGCTGDGRHPDREESAGKPTNRESKLPIGKPMIHDDIIRMAREAGDWNGQTAEFNDVGLERFAALVAAHERERIIAANAPEIEKVNEYIKALEDSIATVIRARGEK